MRKKGSSLPHWERRGELYEGFLKHGSGALLRIPVSRPGIVLRLRVVTHGAFLTTMSNPYFGMDRYLKMNSATVVDVATSSSYIRGHVPGAWFVIRARLAETLKRMPPSASFVVTRDDTALAAFTAHDLANLTGKPRPTPWRS